MLDVVTQAKIQRQVGAEPPRVLEIDAVVAIKEIIRPDMGDWVVTWVNEM